MYDEEKAQQDKWVSEQKRRIATQESGAVIGGMGRAAGLSIGRPEQVTQLPPIEREMTDQGQLIDQLDSAVMDLESALASILSVGPARTEANHAGNVKPQSCPFEGLLAAKNDRIRQILSRLRDVRGAICL